MMPAVAIGLLDDGVTALRMKLILTAKTYVVKAYNEFSTIFSMTSVVLSTTARIFDSSYSPHPVEDKEPHCRAKSLRKKLIPNSWTIRIEPRC